MSLLSVKHLTKNFGGLCAVSNVSMEINEHELIGLIGPNGAGKTTLFNLLTGVYEPSEGSIELNVDGKMTEIGGMKPYRVTQMGLSRTFQNIRLFKNMSALENVKVGMHKDVKYGTLSAILRLPSYYKEEIACSERLRSCFGWSACTTSATNVPAIFLMASSAVWRSPARWHPVRRSCSWMSRQPA